MVTSNPGSNGGPALPVTLMYGSQSFQGSSAKVNLFVMHGDDSDKRDLAGIALRAGRPTKTAASTDGYEENGVWYQAQADPNEENQGRVVMIQASQSRNGSPFADGCIMVALRKEAPLVRVAVTLPPYRGATYSSIPAFVGQGDVLAKDQLRDYGVVLRAGFIKNHFNLDELAELFDISELAPGSPPPVTILVEDPDGKARRVSVSQERPRRVRIRR